MARVEIATQGWGWVTDTQGNALNGRTVTLTGTVFTTSGGSTTISPIVTGADGTIPGWIDSGTYTLAIPSLSVTHQVEAVSGSTGGGSGVPAGTSGASQTLKHKRDNTVVWVGDTHIDLSAYGLPTDGTSDCTPAFTTMRAAESGGVVRVPRGTYRLLTDLDLTWGQYALMGEGKFNTNLWASNDTITGTNSQTGGTSAVTLSADAWGEKFSLVGPLSMNKSNTASAPKRSGLNLRDRCWLRDVRVEAFNQGIQIDGNHQTIYNCVVTNCLYNMAWTQSAAGYATHVAASLTHGNQTLIDVDLTGCGLASVMIDGFSKIDSASLMQVHMGFGQRGIDALAKGAGGQQIAIGNTSFYDCSFESVGDTYINDLGWNTANRRLMAYVQFFNQLTGPQDTAYSNIGGGLEMIKFGMVQDVRIHGRVGDSSNTSFGSVGWGTTSTACGFRFEQANGFYHTFADTLWSAAGAQGKPMFRWEGGLIDWSDVYFTILDGGYVCSALKNGSGGTLTNENLVSGVTPGSPTGTSGVKHYDGTGAAIGRVIAGGPLTNGLIVPIAYEGRLNGPPTADATIAIGSSLAPVSGGGVKKAAAGEQIVGTAFAAPSGGTVAASFRGPWTARF
jgi:hypothetical protein